LFDSRSREKWGLENREWWQSGSERWRICVSRAQSFDLWIKGHQMLWFFCLSRHSSYFYAPQLNSVSWYFIFFYLILPLLSCIWHCLLSEFMTNDKRSKVISCFFLLLSLLTPTLISQSMFPHQDLVCLTDKKCEYWFLICTCLFCYGWKEK